MTSFASAPWWQAHVVEDDEQDGHMNGSEHDAEQGAGEYELDNGQEQSDGGNDRGRRNGR